jgi:alpha-glucosidase
MTRVLEVENLRISFPASERGRVYPVDGVSFWLDRGVDGFRLDALNFLFHSEGLEDNPPLPPHERGGADAPAVNPYGHQRHVYDKNRPEVAGFLRRLRALLNRYPGAMAVGEVGEGKRGLELIAEYTCGGDKVHKCYSFEFLSQEPPTPAGVRSLLDRFEEAASDGWCCWSVSNHDVVRHASRWGEEAADRQAEREMRQRQRYLDQLPLVGGHLYPPVVR